jgi:hypothetical protein
MPYVFTQDLSPRPFGTRALVDEALHPLCLTTGEPTMVALTRRGVRFVLSFSLSTLAVERKNVAVRIALDATP